MYFRAGSKPSGSQKLNVSSEGELKSTLTAPPPKPSVVLAQSQAAGMPPAKKPKLFPQSSMALSSGSGVQQSSSSGGLFSNPIRVTQQSSQSSLPAANRPGKMPSKTGIQSLSSSQLTSMDGK